MINIKLTFDANFDSFDISQFIGNENFELNGCKFWINQKIENPDVWFVFENLNLLSEKVKINPKNIIFLSAETSYNDNHFNKLPKNNFLKQFGLVYSIYDLNIPSTKDLPFLPWMINANHGQTIFCSSKRDVDYFLNLEKLNKPKILSVICSKKDFTDGHRDRLNFVYKLKEHFDTKLDWYGNDVNRINQKWEGIAPYKYHIAIENKQKDYLISEKLYDSYLGLSYPFYYGAPNVNKYFPENSYTLIDIKDIKKSVEIIEEAIYSNIFEKNFEFILKSKDLVCKDYNLFQRLSKVSVDVINDKNQFKKNYTLKNLQYFEKKHNKKDLRLRNFYRILKKIFSFMGIKKFNSI